MDKNKQKGLTLIGLILVGALLAFALLLAFRCVPAWTEYMAVVRVIKAVANEGDASMTIAEVRKSFDRRAIIDDIATISGKDLSVYKQGGKLVVAAEYERRVPIAGNTSLVFEFSASSAGR